jgi:hypothetical protein
MASLFTQPLHLLAVLGIVIFLMWFSQTKEYEEEFQESTASNFKLFLFLSPFLLILIFLVSYSSGGRFHYPLLRPEYESIHQGGGLPWGTASFLVLLLVLLSYQSSFRLKWFGPLSR